MPPQSPTWEFREKGPREVDSNPANTEFFAQQDVADRLVRESGQNTIDAARDGEPARLVYSLTTAPAECWSRYFSSLWPHLEVHPELREVLPDREAPIQCLLVEDFGTTGLTGPLAPENRQAAEQFEKDHRLYWFFKNVGRTSKTGEQLGSFGIGKTVFPYSSRINAFFGLTIRNTIAGEAAMVALGQAQLRQHRLQGSDRENDPFGFFAWQDSEYEAQRPISEPFLLDEIRRTFGLIRGNDEIGLSVIIPYPADGLTRTDLARAAIKQFFLPILSGQLVIEIHSDTQTVLSASTLLQAIDGFNWEAGEADILRRRVRLAKWAIDEGRNSLIQLSRPSSIGQPHFESTMFDAATRTDLCRRFISGDRIAIRVPTPVEPKGAQPVWSYVDVFLEYDRLGASREDVYARKGLTLIEHSGQARQTGLHSILLAEDRPVYEMLRSSENVAHTKWRQRGADRLSQQYTRGAAKVGYVLGVVPGLVQALLSPEEEADWWTLADLFPEPVASPLPDQPVSDAGGTVEGIPPDDNPTEDEGVDPPGPGPIPKGPPRQWRAKPTRDGMIVESNPAYEGALRPMKLTLAYGLLNRKGYRRHSENDFSLRNDPSMFVARAAEVEALHHNVLRITPNESEFSVTLKNFDRRRSLDYQVAVEKE